MARNGSVFYYLSRASFESHAPAEAFILHDEVKAEGQNEGCFIVATGISKSYLSAIMNENRSPY